MTATVTVGHPFEVGDIFYNSWGYDQTNIDFYQVVKTTAKSVRLARIKSGRVEGSEGFMSERCVPLADEFVLDRDGNRKEATKFPYQPSWRSDGSWAINFTYGGGDLFTEGSSLYRSWYA